MLFRNLNYLNLPYIEHVLREMGLYGLEPWRLRCLWSFLFPLPTAVAGSLNIKVPIFMFMCCSQLLGPSFVNFFPT